MLNSEKFRILATFRSSEQFRRKHDDSEFLLVIHEDLNDKNKMPNWSCCYEIMLLV